ncbi:MAG: hypothetical protein K6A44_03865 [bacterium]|nr:hypothetical protein [bacterium]
MNDNLYKSILDNIPYPVAIQELTGDILYQNSAYSNSDAANIQKKEIELGRAKYILLTKENDQNQSHQDFVSTVSHELRTPLTSIRGFADTMLMSQDKLSKEQTNKFLQIIRNQSDRLTRLVENLLEVSNISKKENLVFKEIVFEKFLAPLILMFERKYPNRNYETFFTRNIPNVWADADHLEQIMTNLIDNASKYSQDGSTVTIKTAYKNGNIEIKVIDEGVIIPSTHLDKIFNKFSRIDNPLTRKVEGSGLGLYITKALVEQMNGTIKAENYENGNIFTLTLPACSVEGQLEAKLKGDTNER